MKNALENLRWMRPVESETERLALLELAHEDRHELIAPSHIFLARGEPVGYAAIATVPLILPWFHSKKCRVADSLYFINQMENLVANLSTQATQLMCVPVVKDSPFQPHIERLGYFNAGPVCLTFKKVK